MNAEAVRGGEDGTGEGTGEGREGRFTLAATLRECTPGRSCAAAATDPPTPTGDEKGRENERRAENRCGASRLSQREREREGEAGEGKEREKQGLDAEISVTYSPCAKISTPLDRWKPNWDKVCDDERYHMRDATGESIGPYFDLTLNTYIAF